MQRSAPEKRGVRREAYYFPRPAPFPGAIPAPKAGIPAPAGRHGRTCEQIRPGKGNGPEPKGGISGPLPKPGSRPANAPQSRDPKADGGGPECPARGSGSNCPLRSPVAPDGMPDPPRRRAETTTSRRKRNPQTTGTKKTRFLSRKYFGTCTSFDYFCI